MNKWIDTVLFDFDYTLVDSSVGVGKCINFALEILGFSKVDLPTACKTIGLPLRDTFFALVGVHHHTYADEFVRLFVSHADLIMADHTRLFPAVRQSIHKLHTHSYRMGIISTNLRYRIEAVLAREHLIRMIPEIIGGEDVQRHKPEPDGLLTAIAHLNSTPARSVYVGDSITDAETARRANVAFIALLSGVTSRCAFEPYDAYAVIDDIRHLPDVISSYAPRERCATSVEKAPLWAVTS